MENSQINEAQNKYEAGLEDSQPATAPTDYELAQMIHPSEWDQDCAEYIIGETAGERMLLLVRLRRALKASEVNVDDTNALQEISDADVGRLVRCYFTDYLRKTKGAV